MSEFKPYQEFEAGLDYQKIILVVIAIITPIIVGLIYFGIIPLDLKLYEPVVEPPIITEPEPISVEIPEVITSVTENPNFLSSNKEGLLPTTPQNIDKTPDTKSLEPTTPQKSVKSQTGNLDDIDSKYRRFLESGYTIDAILYVQNTPCQDLTDNDMKTYHDMIGVKGC